MRVFLAESNIHIKSAVKEFTLKENKVSLVKLITVPLDIVRLKKEVGLATPNLLILDLDNFKSSMDELDAFFSLELFRYVSIIVTSKTREKYLQLKTKVIFVKLSNYSNREITEIDEITSIMYEKLDLFNKIKVKIREEVKKKEQLNIEKSTRKTIGVLRDMGKEDMRERFGKEIVNLELDQVVPSANSVLNKKIVVIGSSIGGIEVLEKIIGNLPKKGNVAPILVTQHISAKFTENLVKRLNKTNANINVQAGQNNKIILPNNVYIAPSEKHMGVTKTGFKVMLRVFEDQTMVSRHKPSIDVMFRSVNNVVGGSALGIILTGMGKDGVKGMGELYKSGATTLAQEKKTCTVQGIAGECIVKGFITKEVSIEEIIEYIVEYGI